MTQKNMVLLKNLVLYGALLALVLAFFFQGFQPYEVEFSHTGQCVKVEFKGKVVPDGCQRVNTGLLTNYSSYVGGK